MNWFGYRLDVPSADPETPLTIEEYRWCMRVFVRADLLRRFTPLWTGDLSPARRNFELFSERCHGKDDPSVEIHDAGLGPLRRFGVLVVREALAEVKAVNPMLVVRPTLPEGVDVGGLTEDVPVREAQSILYFLGFGPGEADGRVGPGTSEAVRSFQDALITARGRSGLTDPRVCHVMG
jgi:hypothetical protein